MRIREETYWAWADSQLHSRSHDEELSDGTSIDVQVRLSRTGGHADVPGVYGRRGKALFEEYYPSCPGETMSRALVRGVDRARALATDAVPMEHPRFRRQA
ncbi:hypothetical protein NWF32_26050 [Pseudomonas qingdaonensis]|nr:hypothetical protein [Pseudomonas qingdaonensis]